MIRHRLRTLVLVGCAGLLPAARGHAVELIANPAQAPREETLQLRERWRVGADDDDVLLGQITVVISGPDGEIFALDTQLAHVLVFGPDGTYRRTLGREGEGPGEFRQPIGMFLTGDGRLAVQQAFPGRLVYVDPADGTPRGSWDVGHGDDGPGGMTFLTFAAERGGTFAVAGNRSLFDMEHREIHGTEFLAVIGPDGQESRRLCELPTTRSLVAMTIDELAEHNPADRGLWAISPDGLIYTVPTWTDYLIEVHDRSGELVRRISRAHEARRRTEAEKAERRESMRMNVDGMVPDITWKLQDRARAVDRIQILDDGSLWVRDSRGDLAWDEAGRQSFGVFDATGRLQRQVTLAAPLPGEGNRLVLLDDGRVVMIKGLESLAISISAGDEDETITSDEPLGDTLLELICFEGDPR
ncbi:MAG: 6-bladed beta-propeller [Candidatus Krumholzibacteriia bacterium]